MRENQYGRRDRFLLRPVILFGVWTAFAAYGADRLAPDEMVAKQASRPPVLDAIVLASDYSWIPEGSVNTY